jgi:hypothetical protein
MATTMSCVLRNSITTSISRSGLGGSRAKNTTDLAPCELLPLPGRESLEVDAKYGTGATPLPPAVGGGDERRTSAPATVMRAGASGRRDSSGGA